MKRSINRWTTTIATAALLGLPVAAAAQQPSTPPQQQPAPTEPQQPAPQPTQPQPTPAQPTQPPAQPQPTQPQQPQPTPSPTPQPTDPQPTQPTTPPSTTQQPMSSAAQSVSPEEHLRQAKAAFEDIKLASIPARNRSEFQQLRRHLTALENPGTPAATSGTASRRGSKATPTTANANSWGTDVAAIDRILSNITGSDTAGTSGAGTTGATGTAGSTRGHAASSVTIDEATRAKLMEIRTHITAYAAAKAGASSTPKTDSASTSTTANETMTPAAQAGNTTAAETPRSGNYATPGSSTGQTPAAAQGTASPGTMAQGTAAQDPAAPAQDTAAGAVKVDAEAAHRSLLAARDSLNQLTQLPAAAQLNGEARTQVQQLIANFNELITNTTDWRASYAKVATSMSALLGPDNTDAEATGGAPTTTTGATGTAGAVGTSGTATVQLDPAVRAKLVEMRNNLNEFQKASGGMSK